MVGRQHGRWPRFDWCPQGGREASDSGWICGGKEAANLRICGYANQRICEYANMRIVNGRMGNPLFAFSPYRLTVLPLYRLIVLSLYRPIALSQIRKFAYPLESPSRGVGYWNQYDIVLQPDGGVASESPSRGVGYWNPRRRPRRGSPPSRSESPSRGVGYWNLGAVGFGYLTPRV